MPAVAKRARAAAEASGASLKNEFVAFKTNRIVEVASHLFYQRGYSSCTLDNVADNLGVTKPFLYSYFKNKEAILAAICEVGISEVHAEVLPADKMHVIAELQSRGKVVAMVGDWTRPDPEITTFLNEQGAAGVPLYLWYEPGTDGEQLPQVLTSDMLVERAKR